MPEKAESNAVSTEHPDDPQERRCYGVCKWFNVVKGYGFLILDDTKEDVFVHQSELVMEGFRSLGEGERCAFFMRERDGGKGKEAHNVTAEDTEKPLVGSTIRPLGKRKDRLIRCYKCGKFGNHVAQRCKKVEITGKACYHCESPDHLFSACPNRKNLPAKGDDAPEVEAAGVH